MIEGRRSGEQSRPRLRRMLVDPVHRIVGAEHHHQRAGRADRRVERVQKQLGPALTDIGAGEADLAERCVDHEQVAAA